MGLLEVVIVIICVGVVLYAIDKYLPMAPGVKEILNAVVIIALVVWILQVFGIWSHLNAVRIGSIGR